MRRALLLLAAGCELVDPVVDQAIEDSTIAGGPPGILTSGALPPQEWRVALPGVPEAIFLESVALEADHDLGFLTSLRFYVEPLDAASGLGRRLVAWSVGPLAGRTATLVTARALDITPWVVEGLRLIPEVTGTAPPVDVTVSGNASLQVDVL